MKEIFSNGLKKLIYTGALVVTMTTTLTGCGFIPGPVDILKAYVELNKEDSNDETEEVIIEENSTTNTPTNTPTNTIINTGAVSAGSSYNKYLYEHKIYNLNDTVIGQDITLSESKETDNADRRITVGEYNEQIIVLPEEESNEFIKWVKSQDVIYVYANLYQVDVALTEAAKYDTSSNQYSDFICDINTIPSIDLIYSTIKENNIDTLKQNPGYEALPDTEIKLIAKLLHEDLLLIKDKISENELKRIYSMLNEISAVGIDSSDFIVNDLRQQYNARVLEDGTIIIDLNNIALLPDEQAKVKTYDHEIMHLFQRMCPDNQIEGYYQIGNSQYFDSVEVNTLHWNYHYEGGAELFVMNKYGAINPLVYKTMVGYVKSLDYIAMLKPEYSESIIEDSTMSTDPNKLFEIFGATTEQEKLEIIYMMYSTDFVQNAREDFINQYVAAHPGEQLNVDSIKYNMKKSICQTLTKYFYINLAKQIQTGNISLQDTFYLINVFESDLSYHTDYDMPEKYEYNKEFIDKYTDIQNQFFTYIANNNNMSFEEVEALFNDYSMVIRTDDKYMRNCDLDWLSQEERNFVYNLNTVNLWAMTYNIRNIDAVLNNNLGR